MTPPRLHFHDFDLDPGQFELRRAGHRIRLERKPMELLILLAEKRGQLVAREEIIERVWGKDFSFDAERGINNTMRKIRAALNDDPERPRFVETVVGKGYRFIGPIEELAKPPGQQQAAKESVLTLLIPAQSRTVLLRVALAIAASLALGLLAWLAVAAHRSRRSASGGVASIRSIAVLPITNLSGDPSQEYFADGMTDELITNLAKISELRVTSRTSAMRYRGVQKRIAEIGKELGVDAIIEGTVVRSGDRVRITVQLIHAPTDRHLWAEEYSRDLRDVLTLQSDVARDIAREIRIRLTPQEQARLARVGPVDPQAHEFYLRGTYFSDKWTPEASKRAIGYFDQALQKDPQYAAAYAARGIAYDVLGIFGEVQSYPQAKAAAQKALQIDDALPEAHNTLAWAEYTYDWDVAAAEREFRRAIDLNPSYASAHSWYGMFLSHRGRIEEALQQAALARQLDPLSLPNITLVWRAYYNAHQYDKAIEICREALDMDPTFVRARQRLVTILEQKGDLEKAIQERRQGRLLGGENPTEVERETHSLQKALANNGARGYWLEKLKRTPSGKFPEGTMYGDLIELANIQTHMGSKQEAFRSLQRACELHVPYLIWSLPGDPAFDPLRSDPRFGQLLRCLVPRP